MSDMIKVLGLVGFDRTRTTKSDVRHPGIKSGATTTRRTIGRAVTIVAKKRSASRHTLAFMRVPGIKKVGWAVGVDHRSAFPGTMTIKIDPPPIGTPFPNVARHIEKTEAVRGIGFHWRGPGVAIGFGILMWKLTLLDIGLRFFI